MFDLGVIRTQQGTMIDLDLLPMYRAVPTRLTAITKAITAADTAIEVEDPAVLAEAPNVAVIGNDNPETVLYTAIEGNTLTGITRGFSRTTPLEHKAGTEIKRVLVSEEWNTLLANVEALRDSVTGVEMLQGPPGKNGRNGKDGKDGTTIYEEGIWRPQSTFVNIHITNPSRYVKIGRLVTLYCIGMFDPAAAFIQINNLPFLPDRSLAFHGDSTVPCGHLFIAGNGTHTVPIVLAGNVDELQNIDAWSIAAWTSSGVSMQGEFSLTAAYLAAE